MNDSRFPMIRHTTRINLDQARIPTLLLYTTSGCHLCEQAETLLRQQTDRPFTLVEIAEDAALLERYGMRIPVLHQCATGEELAWPFDAEALHCWLSCAKHCEIGYP